MDHRIRTISFIIAGFVVVSCSYLYFFGFPKTLGLTKSYSSTLQDERSIRIYCNNVNVYFKDNAKKADIDKIVASVNGSINFYSRVSGYYTIKIPGACDLRTIEETIRYLERSTLVENAEPNYYIERGPVNE